MTDDEATSNFLCAYPPLRYNKKRSLISEQPFCGLDETRTRDPLRDRQVF